jgi:preprotein translocase subunit SecA
MDFQIDKEEFGKIDEATLTRNLYDQAFENYNRKNKTIATRTMPILSQILKTKGATVENILVPFTDGKKQIGVSAALEKSVKSNGAEMIRAMEKMVTLSIIDQTWKEHLRDMDDLKQSVQNAVYEQKDPLIIYKFEGFELFKIFIGKVNEECVSFLMKAQIPIQDPNEVQEARQQRTATNYKESKEESGSSLAARTQTNRAPIEKTAPIKSDKIAGRNERVSVQYQDGSVKKDVKYKVVEEDLKNSKCVLID